MGKPICVIYWIEDDDEFSFDFQTEDEVKKFVDWLKGTGYVYWICWTSMTAKLVS